MATFTPSGDVSALHPGTKQPATVHDFRFRLYGRRLAARVYSDDPDILSVSEPTHPTSITVVEN